MVSVPQPSEAGTDVVANLAQKAASD